MTTTGSDIVALKYTGRPETFPVFLREQCNFEFRHTQGNGYERFTLPGGAIINLYPTGSVNVQGSTLARQTTEKIIAARLEEHTAPLPAERIFIVHGHDEKAREQLELVLHRFGIPEHFILQNTAGNGLTIIEELEKQIGGRGCDFGIVLLTPDDYGYAKRDGEISVQPRARQNVVLEMGMLLAALGRERVVVLKKQHLELPSDAAGILYLPFNEHVKETVPRLAQRLMNAGFTIPADRIARAAS
ncbi:nucleotide-binding protein [Salmonella enterica]